MGLTDKGYQRRSYQTILDGKIQRAKEKFGENIDTGDQTVLGKILRINAYDQAIYEEEAEAVYYASKPNSASGQSLDRLVPLGSISRNPATAARYNVQIQGTNGYIVPAGFLVGTDTGLTYWTTQEYTIGEDGTCMMEASCTEAGTIGNVSAGAINKAVNPDANITAVAGVECLSAGVDEESDAELRERLNAAMSGAGGNSIDALVAALLRVPTVRYARVIENDGAEADSDGRPPNSFEAFVQGGEDYHQEIAKTIFAHRSIGIKTVGDIAHTVIDVCGNEKTVRFSHTPTTSVVVRMSITKSTSFPSDGAAQIEANVISHINALGVGKTLVLNGLYTPIYAVAGVSEVVTLELSTDGGSSFSTGNVTVPAYGSVVCSSVTVEVAT